jgi:hypothetical protein
MLQVPPKRWYLYTELYGLKISYDIFLHGLKPHIQGLLFVRKFNVHANCVYFVLVDMAEGKVIPGLDRLSSTL